MSEFEYKFNQDDFSLATSESGSNDAWVMSFADVVTVLLCFFIIFYVIEKQLTKTAGFGNLEGSIQESKTIVKTKDMQLLLENIKSIEGMSIVETSQFLEIQFPPQMFFASGKTRLTKEAELLIAKILPALKGVKKDYYLQIQGHTDNTVVQRSNKRWWQDNMQLSVERSLSVYYYLLQKGVSKELLTVTGFGASKPERKLEKSLQRRISFKFEPVVN